MYTGIMFIGLNGVNSSSIISGCVAMSLGMVRKQYGLTESKAFKSMELIDVDNMRFSGWDFFYKSQKEMVNRYGILSFDSQQFGEILDKIVPYKGIHTAKDIDLEDRFDYYYQPDSIEDAISVIRKNIKDFRARYPLGDLMVINMGSPGKKVNPAIKQFSYDRLLELSIGEVPSSLLYAVAAIQEGASFVDFTPGEALEFACIYDMAEKNNVQLSGRDGSTGQTMLKLTLAQMFKIRNLRINGWYSTNILGNHDGYILSNPSFAETKIEDKRTGLFDLLEYCDFPHKVTIDYYEPRFDSKESWDSIDFSGWMGARMSLKLNWQGSDALLAAPMVLDIIRLIHEGHLKKLSGFQKQLGVFYKHPFGMEGKSLEYMYYYLLQFYTGIDCLNYEIN